MPGVLPYRIIYEETAMRKDGTTFSDHEIHRQLRSKGMINPRGEWFTCSLQDLRSAYLEDIGLYDTVLKRSDYQATFVNEPAEIIEVASHENGK